MLRFLKTKHLKCTLLLRCQSNKIYVSTANGELPLTPTKTLGNNSNGRPDNVIMISGNDDGVYTWRVDCIEEYTGNVRKGNNWTFTVNSSL